MADTYLPARAGPVAKPENVVHEQCTTRYYNTRYKDFLDITTKFLVIFLICSVRVVISSEFTALDIRSTAWAENSRSAALWASKFLVTQIFFGDQKFRVMTKVTELIQAKSSTRGLALFVDV